MNLTKIFPCLKLVHDLGPVFQLQDASSDLVYHNSWFLSCFLRVLFITFMYLFTSRITNCVFLLNYSFWYNYENPWICFLHKFLLNSKIHFNLISINKKVQKLLFSFNLVTTPFLDKKKLNNSFTVWSNDHMHIFGSKLEKGSILESGQRGCSVWSEKEGEKKCFAKPFHRKKA